MSTKAWGGRFEHDLDFRDAIVVELLQSASGQRLDGGLRAQFNIGAARAGRLRCADLVMAAMM